MIPIWRLALPRILALWAHTPHRPRDSATDPHGDENCDDADDRYDRAGLFQVVFTVLKVTLLIAIALIGFTYANGSWGNFATTVPAKSSGFIVALVAAPAAVAVARTRS